METAVLDLSEVKVTDLDAVREQGKFRTSCPTVCPSGG
jgi:hypothetical protein